MPPEPTPSVPSDEQLARRAQQGCVESFEELVRRFQVPLRHFLARRSGPIEADDLAQETFVRAYQYLHRYRDTWRFGTWLFTIGRRLSINHARARRPTGDAAVLETLDSAEPTPAEAAVAKESRRRLWQLAAEVLSERQHTALWLYYVEEMPVKQIAKVVRRSPVAVKTMLFRARKRMLKEIEQTAGTGESRAAAPRSERGLSQFSRSAAE